MRTVKSIQAAERFLRKLAGDPNWSFIQIMHRNRNGRSECSWRIMVETEESIEIDSGAQITLQDALDCVSERVTTERVRLAGKRNSDAVKRLALHRPEVHR